MLDSAWQLVAVSWIPASNKTSLGIFVELGMGQSLHKTQDVWKKHNQPNACQPRHRRAARSPADDMALCVPHSHGVDQLDLMGVNQLEIPEGLSYIIHRCQDFKRESVVVLRTPTPFSFLDKHVSEKGRNFHSVYNLKDEKIKLK